MAAIKRNATARWTGTGKDGKGALTTQSGVLSDSQYGFNTRFENGPGTNPEELIAAAHAGCFTMALAFQISGAGHTPESLETKAVVSLEKEGEGFTVTASALTLHGVVPGMSEEEFRRLAGVAEKNCPISKVLNAKITLEATFG
ncbi:OsmC family protein [Roseomonas sp. NAR14]|uniref:OsmC family protein n=1 Tax=Roseomonas acroporae TaxID=2937791 RepID=A0A9X1Y638_9PROT|nr:OsmC family protein [Roseomonas acroporae]MCK8784939.1 OsmC family protein [Roseomonas acroporae]